MIIPNYNGTRTLQSTLLSVVEQIPEDTEIIVVDDHSLDDSIALVERSFPSAKIFRNATNLGAAATRNRGLRLAQGDWLMFIDSDVYLQRECLSLLLKATDQADIVYPSIYYSNGELMYPVGAGQLRYLLISPIFLIRRSALAHLAQPFFDEIYRIYCEDTDFFLRAYLAGLKTSYVPEAKAIHNVITKVGNREERYFLEVRNALYGSIKFLGMPELNQFDHAFKVINILKVVLCGFLNFNLFDMQARGYRKRRSLLDNVRLVLASHNKISPRGSHILLGLTFSALFWNIQHFPQALQSRNQIRQSTRKEQYSLTSGVN